MNNIDRQVNFRFSADTTEIKRTYNSIKKDLQQLKKITKSVSTSMQKSISSSTKNITKMFKNTGKTSKLVFKEMQKAFHACSSMMSKDSNKLGQTMKSTFKSILASIVTALSITTLIAFGKGCIDLASDIEEVQNVVDVSFGDMSNQVEAFSKSAMKNFGLTELQAKQMASTFMSMGNSMQLRGQVGADMALNLTGLAGDMSSFYNVSAEVAQTALNSIYTGETESLKKFGVVMNEVNLKSYAMSKGLGDNIQAMSQADKVMLRYNYTMETLQNTQGDFLRTQSSWANQTRILSGLWTEFKTIVGESLKTVFTPLLEVLNAILTDLVNIARTLTGTMATVGKNSGVSTLTDEYENLEEQINSTADAAESGLASFDKINTIGSDNTNSSNVSTNTGTTSGDTETSKQAQRLTIFQKIGRQLKEVWGNVKDIFSKTFENIDFSKLSSSLKSFSGESENAFYALIQGIANFIKWSIEEGLPLFIDILNQVIPLLVAFFESVDWEFIKETFRTIMEIMASVLSDINSFAKENPELFKVMVNLALLLYAALSLIIPVIVIISGLIAAGVSSTAILIGVLVLEIIALLGLIVWKWEEIWETMTEIWETMTTFLSTRITQLKTFIRNHFMIIVDILKGIWSSFCNYFTGEYEKSFTGLLRRASDLVKNIAGVFANGIQDMYNNLTKTKMSVSLSGVGELSLGVLPWDMSFLPHFADGGVIDQPTIGLTGEYAGVRANREIITPENTMASVFSSQMSPMVDKLSQIIEILLSLDPSFLVQIGNQDVEAVITRLQNKQSYRRNPRTI